MNTSQKNYIDMFVAVKEVYEQHKPIFDSMVARMNAFASFLLKFATLNSLAAAQTSNITGVTQDKEVLRKNLCELSFFNMTVIKSFAVTTNDNELKTQMDYSLWDLLHITDESIANFCQLRLDKANTMLASLADYNITAPTIAAWQDAIDDYNEAMGNPRNATTDLSTTTDTIKTLVPEIAKLLSQQIDPLVQPLKATNKPVHTQYFKSRILINRGNPPQEPENPNTLTFSGILTDNENGAVIPNAKFTVGTIIFFSDEDGYFEQEFTITETTTFNGKIQKPGYETSEGPIQMTPGVNLTQDLQLNPTGYLFGTTTNFATTFPLGGVIVTDVASGISTTSDANGNYVLEGIPEGNRDIMYALANFQTTVINRNFVKRIPVEQNVSLQPNP